MPAEDCLIIPTRSINWCDLIFASAGLFFRIGIKDFDINILVTILFSYKYSYS